MTIKANFQEKKGKNIQFLKYYVYSRIKRYYIEN